MIDLTIRRALPFAPQRFLDKITVCPTGCWEWTGVRIPGGYGQFWWRGRMEGAHIMAVRFAGREVPTWEKKGQVIVRHRCDNPPCCNPSDLLVGTQADNQADMVAKNRQALGENHGMAILTEDEARAILRREETAPEAAIRYGVSTATIYDIWYRRSWRHLTRSPR